MPWVFHFDGSRSWVPFNRVSAEADAYNQRSAQWTRSNDYMGRGRVSTDRAQSRVYWANSNVRWLREAHARSANPRARARLNTALVMALSKADRLTRARDQQAAWRAAYLSRTRFGGQFSAPPP